MDTIIKNKNKKETSRKKPPKDCLSILWKKDNFQSIEAIHVKGKMIRFKNSKNPYV